MTPKSRDPLLAASRVILIIAMGISLVAGAAFAIGMIAIAASHGDVMKHFTADNLGPGLYWWLHIVLALLIASTALSFLFLRHLYRIVGTVADGDPFVPINADRFAAMGWLSLGVNVLLVGIPIASEYFTPRDNSALTFNFAFGGLLLALVLFVIARVFREGTRMREELEGTV